MAEPCCREAVADRSGTAVGSWLEARSIIAAVAGAITVVMVLHACMTKPFHSRLIRRQLHKMITGVQSPPGPQATGKNSNRGREEFAARRKQGLARRGSLQRRRANARIINEAAVIHEPATRLPTFCHKSDADSQKHNPAIKARLGCIHSGRTLPAMARRRTRRFVLTAEVACRYESPGGPGAFPVALLVARLLGWR